MLNLSHITGFIINETSKIVSIVTMHSVNIKTGDMAQLWILNRHVSPVDAARDGSDSMVCGNCKHRPANQGTCYVTLFQGPGNVWKAYQKGKYPELSPKDYGALCAGRAIRFGAYGDPAFVPFRILEKLARVSAGFTGYTHQWETCPTEYRNLVMASVDNIAEYYRAKEKGYRTFRVSVTGDDNRPGEITCPATTMGAKCLRCLLCAGNARRAKDITIKVHGAHASRFVA